MKYTTIRLAIKDKERLERLAKLLKCKNIIDALRFALDAAEKELNRGKGNLDEIFASLKYGRDIGETRAEDVDKYLYGEG